MKVKQTKEGFMISINDLKLVQHSTKDPMCVVGISSGKYKLQHGMFKIKEKIEEKISLPNYSIQKKSDEEITVELYSADKTILLELHLKQKAELLEIQFEINDLEYNRLWINLEADETEAIYGCGEQFSEVNLRGHKVPIWVQEQGVGRGDPKWFTFLANLLKNAGGNHFTTYYAQPTFLSSKNYFCHVEMSSYSVFDFRKKSRHQLYLWEMPQKIVIGKFDSALKTVGKLTDFLGKQVKLVDWLYDGFLMGVQGGTEIVRKKLKKSKEMNLKIAGVWCQDWEGRKITSFGKQLFWNWEYDSKLYPELPAFIKELQKTGTKFTGYINTFLNLDGALYKEASKKGYLVMKPNGEEYHVVITTFPAAILDLTNPETVQWIKDIIKSNLLGIGLDGWMCDFGEYLPTDAVLHSGIDAEKYHNLFPVEWARINKEAIEEAGKLDEVMFFTRAGYTGTSKHSPLIWAGDQVCGWSIHDGLASVIPAAISLAVSGIGYYHFDIGGYTTMGPFKRSKAMFQRWAEAAAFTMVMRSHEGSRPEDNWQFDSDDETLLHLAKMVDIHVKLKPYLQALSKEYQTNGYPPIRPCYLHYEEDSQLHKLKYQYLLGRDLLIAPVYRKKKTTRKVYLPKDNWIHLWSKKQYSGGWVTVEAPIGEPPVFYRSDSQYKSLFEQLLQ